LTESARFEERNTGRPRINWRDKCDINVDITAPG